MKDPALVNRYDPWLVRRVSQAPSESLRCEVCHCIPEIRHTVPFHGCRFNVQVCESDYCQGYMRRPL